MKPKTMILLVVAVGCGLGASYMTSRLLAERANGEAEQPQVVVLVAAKNLDMGTILKKPEELFQEKPFLQGEEPKDAIVNAEQLKGKVLKRSLRAGDWISPSDLLGENEDGGLAWKLPDGFLAIGLRVNIDSIAGGFASLPHSRVDIISTVRRGDDKSSYSQVLLQNVLVLAADQQTHRDEAGRAMPANVVTVALKPEDAVKVTLAKELGPLSLALRKFNDMRKTDSPAKITVEQINQRGTADAEVVVSDDPVVPPVPPPVVAPVPTPTEPAGTRHRLRVIHGDREDVVDYLLDEAGEVIRPEVARAEAPPAPPAPPQGEVRPPRPQANQ